MDRYYRISCPQCPRSLKVRREYLHQQVICNHCNHPFVAVPDERRDPDPGLDPTSEGSGLAASLSIPEPPSGRRETSGPDASSITAELHSQRLELDEALARIEALQRLAGEAGRLESELALARFEAEHLHVTVRILEADIAARSGELERLSGAEAGRANQLRALAEDVDRRILEAVAQADSQHLRALEPLDRERSALAAELAVVRTRTAGLERERDEATRRLEEWSREQDDLARRLALAEATFQDGERVRGSEIAALTAEVEALRLDRAEALEHWRAETRQLAQALEEAAARHDLAQRRGDDLSEELRRLRSRLEHIEQSREAELSDQKLAIKALRHDLEARHLEALSASAKETDALRLEREELARTLAERQAEFEVLRTQHASAAEEARHLRTRAEEAKKSLDDAASARLASLAEADQRWDLERRSMAEESNRRVAEAIARAELERASSLAQADADRERLDRDHQALRTETEELRAQIERLTLERDEAARLTVEAEQAHEMLAHRQAESESILRLEIDRHRAGCERLQLQAETLRRERNAAVARAEAATEEQARHQAEVTRLALELDALRGSPRAADLRESPPELPEPDLDGSFLEASSNAPPLDGDVPTSLAASALSDEPNSPDEQFRKLRNHLRTIHQAEERERMNRRLFTRLTRIWRQEDVRS